MSEPLIDKKNNDGYGSLSPSAGDVDLCSSGIHAGYCMVFDSETKHFILRADSQHNKLRITSNIDEKEFKSGKWSKVFYERGMNNLFKELERTRIKHKITTSKDGKYIFVIISAHIDDVEEWAIDHDIDIPIEPKEAVKIGRDIGRRILHFPLAENTELTDDDNDQHDDDIGSNDEDDEYHERIERPSEKLPLECWHNIHISYKGQDDLIGIFKKHGDHVDDDDDGDDTAKNILSHRLYLRILYEMLTDDKGANYIVEKYVANPSHPLVKFFALHHSKRPEFTQEKCFKFRSPKENELFVDDIRDYYGENIAFYFAFLCHYTKWLYPMAIFGFIWFIVQMIYGIYEDGQSIAVPGSTIIVLIAITWSTIMIENWYRREWKLRFKWGMLRYRQTEVPRPAFEGKFIYSPDNGEIVETYKSLTQHGCKILFSLSTMLLCICIVLGCVIGLFLLRGQNRNDEMLSIGIGVANSIQIFIMNKIYTVLAYKLNEWEGHRLEQDYYNALVIKRIIFIVVNSFNSLFYIAFFDDNPVYDDDKARMEAVRIQLVTLFVTAIVLQNTLEVLFPLVINPTIKKACIKIKKEEEFIKNSFITEKHLNINVASVHMDESDDIRDDEYQINDNELSDIHEQIELGPSPDVLDNTAEVVVLHGYIMLFVVIFPLMPLLAAINNYFELRIDFYNLTHAQRPIPQSAAGLGVWKTVMSCFNIIAIFSNLALITFRTTLIKDISFMKSGDNATINTQERCIIFYFSLSLILLFLIATIRGLIDDQPQSVKHAIARQETIEKHLLRVSPPKAVNKKNKQNKQQNTTKTHHDDDDEKHD